jgi:RNA polymerase sigma factor (TIGR02999 family)
MSEQPSKAVPTAPTGQVTHLLRAWSDGDQQALEQLLPLVDAELRRLARAYMYRERRDHTLQPTALINEAFIRLASAQNIRWQDRAHFFGICARLMRRVLVDYARARGFQKRGARVEKVSLDDVSVAVPELPLDIIALDLALDALATRDQRMSRVVELRFFGGLTIEETAEVLRVSPDTVKREWRLAKLWLLRQMEVPPR